LKRLWEAYEILQQLTIVENSFAADVELDSKVIKLVNEFEEFINDDFNTAKVLANMFDLVPVINSIKDKHIAADAISASTLELLKQQMNIFVEDILGLQSIQQYNNTQLNGVIELMVNLRKEARQKKDYVLSDRIRNELSALGIQLKDEKDGNISYTIG